MLIIKTNQEMDNLLITLVDQDMLMLQKKILLNQKGKNKEYFYHETYASLDLAKEVLNKDLWDISFPFII